MSWKPALCHVQSASTHSGFPGTLGYLAAESSPFVSLILPLYHTRILTVPDPSPDHNSLKLLLLFPEVQRSSALPEFKASSVQVLAEQSGASW